MAVNAYCSVELLALADVGRVLCAQGGYERLVVHYVGLFCVCVNIKERSQSEKDKGRVGLLHGWLGISYRRWDTGFQYAGWQVDLTRRTYVT